MANATSEQPETLLERALRAYTAGKLREAEHLCRAAIEIRSDCFDGVRLLANIQARLGCREDALASYERALVLSPRDAAVLNDRGGILHELERFDDALASYDAAIALKPDYADAHYNRGATLQHLKRFGEALESYERGLALRPNDAGALNNYGIVLHGLGRFEEALEGYDRALAVQPDFAIAHNNRGVTLQQLKRVEAALASFDRALEVRADYLAALHNRGALLLQLKRFADALATYDRALALRPDDAAALNNRGAVLRKLRRFDEALACFDRALAVQPESAEVLNNRGNTLRELKRFDDALACFDRALAVRPKLAEALNGRGSTLQELGRFEEALGCFDQALAMRPDFVEALNNRGNTLGDLNRFEDALTSYDRALLFEPDYAEALNNRGNVLQVLKRFEDALGSYDRAIANKPDSAKFIMNRGICRLRLGRYREGWADYELRWDDPDFRESRPDFAPWRGEPLDGRRLLVFGEQGLGDTVQFARYLPLLARSGGELTFLPDARLTRLFQSLTAGIETVAELESGQAFDFQCALMSLPHRLGTDLTSIPNSVPYLRPEDALTARWRNRIGRDGFKVGICWQGNPATRSDEKRSIPLVRFRPLGQIPGVRLISLQKGDGLEQLAELPADMTVELPGEDFDRGPAAFIDCAAVMESLDLVVTCDTAIGHVAGALGRRVWVALAHVPHFPWMLDRADSPWYPTMRLFRQTARGAWDQVFGEIAAALRRLVEETRLPRDNASGTNAPCIPVSWGELVDKITILEIKSQRLTSPQALANVKRERDALEAVLRAIGSEHWRLRELRAGLLAVNARLFDIENGIREREAQQQFDDGFVQLARSVYFFNDERGRIKQEINLVLGSELVEEKEYIKYQCIKSPQASLASSESPAHP